MSPTLLPPTLDARVRDEQVRAHYAQLPAMAIAPVAGGWFTVWVLWGQAEQRALLLGMSAITLLSLVRLLVARRYARSAAAAQREPRWRRMAVAGAFVSGCLWGLAALWLYPPRDEAYEVFVVVLLTLLPIVPVAALAAYLPAFYAYYLPCLAPFVLTLALHGTRAERLSALLLLMMLLAMLVFARRYARSLREAIELRIRLGQQSEALQAAVAQRTRFVARASHDLRQPVHAMGLFLELLRRPGQTEVERTAAYLQASQRGLQAMLGNLLDLSKLDAQVVHPQPRPLRLAELLLRLAAEFDVQARSRGLRLRCRAGAATVRSDPLLLERILRNLLSNALKYTRRGGVLLACRRRAAGVAVWVFDTGVGIDPARGESIFDEFNHAGHDDHHADGLGLGLAIAQQTAALLGCTLRWRSVVGRGSAFGLDLELAPDEAVGPASQARPEEPALPVPPAHAFVIDDDAAVRDGTALLLEHWGLRTHAFASVEQALAALAGEGEAPGVLIVDFRLGDGGSGLGAARRVLERIGQPVPVILITGDTAPDRIREAYQAGHFLLHKPVDPQRLRACLSEALRPAQRGG